MCLKSCEYYLRKNFNLWHHIARKKPIVEKLKKYKHPCEVILPSLRMIAPKRVHISQAEITKEVQNNNIH